MSTVTRMELRVVLNVEDVTETVEHPDMGGTPMHPRELEITYRKTPGPMRQNWTIQANLRGPWTRGHNQLSKIHATVGWTSYCATPIPKWVLDKVYGMKPVWFEFPLTGMFQLDDEPLHPDEDEIFEEEL